MKIFSAIKSNYGKYIARGVGAAALYLVARDAHTYGKINADAYMKTKNAIASEYYMNNTMMLDKPSITKAKLKNGIFRYDLDDNFRGFINSAIGYFKGLGTTFVSDVVPLGLGLGAVLAKGKAIRIAKASAWGLGAMAVYSFIKDGLGIGKANDLTFPTE